MRKLFLFMMVSLDGFFEGPNHELDWHNTDAEFSEFAADQLGEMGGIIFGRKTYELMAGFWPTEAGEREEPAIAALMNMLPKTVFSKTLDQVEWRNSRLVKENVAEEVRRLKEQSGKSLAVFGSSNLCVTLIEMGLLDELRIMVNPVVLGRGHTLFAGLRSELRLKLLKTRTFASGNVLLYYAPQQQT